MIRIVDYGMGNLRSVQKGFEKIGATAQFCTRPDEFQDADKLVLPGVGAFRDGIRELRERRLVEPVLEHIASGRPFLGICLGLQLLFDVSFEEGQWEGLGVLCGEVVRLPDRPGMKVPHMGWNTLQPTDGNPLLNGIPEAAHFYFVHSYYVVPEDKTIAAARTDYTCTFTSMVAHKKLFATQFHPEKSQSVGLKLLRNFADL